MILSATIKPHEAVEIGAAMQGQWHDLIDTPVSGGFRGTGRHADDDGGCPDDVMARARPVLEAVSASIHHVGTKAGEWSNGKGLFAIPDRIPIFRHV